MPEIPVVTCPHCSKKFRGKEDLTGKKIKCPGCKAPFVAGGAAKVEAPKPAAVAAKDDDDDDKDFKAYGVGDQEIEYRCPNCAEIMPSETATICLACGYNTLTREWGKTKKTMSVTMQQHLMHLLPGILWFLFCLTLIYEMVYFNVVYAKNNPASWLAHESIRMWRTMITLGILMVAGRFAFNRLVLNPRPQEIEKSK